MVVQVHLAVHEAAPDSQSGPILGLREFMNRTSVGLGIALGLCFGVTLGTAVQDIGVGVAFGVGLGTAFAAFFGASDAESTRTRVALHKPLPDPLGLFTRDGSNGL